MTVRAVTTEIDRLAAIGNARKNPDDGTRDIARALTGVTGARHTKSGCPLAKHLRKFTDQPVRVSRYEVHVGDAEIPLNNAPGDRCILRYFVCNFDDHPARYRWLRTP